jgi:hypothetical protein
LTIFIALLALPFIPQNAQIAKRGRLPGFARKGEVDIIPAMIEAHNPVAVGYQIGGCLGLILAGFLADTWLWFAVVALSSAAGGILAGLIARSIIRLARRA